MLHNLGPIIRTLRKQKGIGLNAFAEELHVSPGYLSNLETGKTDTLSLTLLSQLNEQLDLFPALTQETNPQHELHFRLERLCQLLQTLHDEQPELADYFISHVEKGLQLCSK